MEAFRMLRVFVTGGAGYIGSHVCKELSRQGFDPVSFDNLSTGHRQLVKWGRLIEGDVGDRKHIERAISEVRPTAVMHFAASSFVGESLSLPEKYYRNNVMGSLTLLEAMKATGVSRIVFSSTCATYGVPELTPIREDAPQAPINTYGRTKLVIEQMLDAFEIAHGIRSICLRYFNACGADPEGDIGELHEPEPHLIPRAILAALGEINDFSVFGQDYPTPDGTPIRDYIHVTDLASVHVAALHHLLRGEPSVKLNLGIGYGYSVKDIVQAVTRITGRQIPSTVSARRAGDPAVLVADCTKAKALLGFKPQFSDLDTIIQTAWKWHARPYGSPHIPVESAR
jgi:UDP-arabinose 4-epimerase